MQKNRCLWEGQGGNEYLRVRVRHREKKSFLRAKCGRHDMKLNGQCICWCSLNKQLDVTDQLTRLRGFMRDFNNSRGEMAGRSRV